MSEVADTATVVPIRRKSVLLRLDPEVHNALSRWAADEFRSTNAQIAFVLRRALVDTGRLSTIQRRRRSRSGQPGHLMN
jgi:hypothetical protein